MRILITLLFSGILTLTAFAQQPKFITDSLDSYIEEGLKDWNLPGLALVIVKDGKVVVKKGYGVKNIESREAVDSNTLFMIASNTKLFTGIALAQLEYNGKLSIDDKIIKYFPDFKLYDSLTTLQTSIRDLLSHRIGTQTFQGDFTFWNSSLTSREIRNKMRLLKPKGIFRQDYGYCNSCYMTAGDVIPILTGKPWEVYVYDSLIVPAKMLNTHALSMGIEQRENVATPYTNSFSPTLKKVPYDHWDNLAAAASIVSNVDDLSRWLTLQLDSGRLNGKQVIAWPVLQKSRDVNIILSSRKSAFLPMHFRGYGLGLMAADYNGRQLFWHTGGASGMVSGVCFVPEENLGIAILTNQDNQSFFEMLRYQILDAYLGVPYINRSKQYLSNFTKAREKELADINSWKDSAALRITPPAPLSAFSGEYENELYGKLTISIKDHYLKLKFHSHKNLTASLKYMGNNRWLLEYDNIEYGILPVSFSFEKNKPTAIDLKANDFIDYSWYRFQKL